MTRTNPTPIGSALGAAVRGLVAQHLHHTGSAYSVDDVARLGAAGELPADLQGMYDAVGTYM
jgi:hypothetical protein